MQVNNVGIISFRDLLDAHFINLVNTTDTVFLTPISGLHNTRFGLNYAYARTTADPSLLSRSEQLIRNSNSELSSFQPRLLVIATWNRLAFFITSDNFVSLIIEVTRPCKRESNVKHYIVAVARSSLSPGTF